MFSESIDERNVGMFRSGMAGGVSSPGAAGIFDVIEPKDVGPMLGRFMFALICGSIRGTSGGLPSSKSKGTLPKAPRVESAVD